MSLHKPNKPRTKIASLATKIVSPIIATVLIAGIGTFSYFNFLSLTNLKVAKAACPAGTYANPGGNTFGADPYGGEACLPNTDITPAQLANTLIVCSTNAGGSVMISTTTNTCKFTLPANTKLPTGLKLGIGGASPAGSCTDAAGLITCTNIPAGSTVGNNVPVAALIGSTSSPFANGVVTTGGTVATASCTVTKPCFLKTSQYDFVPKSSTKGMTLEDQSLTIKPGLFSTAAASGNKYVCRISMKTEGKNDDDANFGYAKQTARLSTTSGTAVAVTGTGANAYTQTDYDSTNGCVVKLLKDKQADVKWYYRIVIGQVNSSGTFLDGDMNQAEPSFFFNYGAVLSLNSTVIVLP